jgi:hypothetical protein
VILLCLNSFQTDGSVPNTLVVANCEVVKPRVAAAEHIAEVILNLHTSLFLSFKRRKEAASLFLSFWPIPMFISIFEPNLK